MDLNTDEPQKAESQRKLISVYNMIYASEIVNELWEVIIEHCNGCVSIYPSQMQHTCIMLIKLEHLELYFELVLKNVCVDNVLKKWKDDIATLKIPKSLQRLESRKYIKHQDFANVI